MTGFNPFRVTLGALVFFSLIIISIGDASERLVARNPYQRTKPLAQPIFTEGDRDAYAGRLRVYVVERVSRWEFAAGGPYQYGFLDFALDSALIIPDCGGFDYTWQWSVSEAGYPDVEAGNIMVMAAVFDSDAHMAYSDPPDNMHPFIAYYVEAAASARPGSPGTNTVTSEYTHTVFVEVGGMTWCPYDASMDACLDSVFDSGDYPFHYAWFVMDSNTVAMERMANDYNVYWFPISFVDGGDKVILGQYYQAYYRDEIEKAARRTVFPLSLYVSVDWLGGGLLKIHVKINESGTYVVGDADGSGSVDIDDVVHLINYIFSGGPPPNPLLAGDADCSGDVDIDDVVYIINYIFSGGPAPGDPDGDSIPDC